MSEDIDVVKELRSDLKFYKTQYHKLKEENQILKAALYELMLRGFDVRKWVDGIDLAPADALLPHFFDKDELKAKFRGLNKQILEAVGLIFSAKMAPVHESEVYEWFRKYRANYLRWFRDKGIESIPRQLRALAEEGLLIRVGRGYYMPNVGQGLKPESVASSS